MKSKTSYNKYNLDEFKRKLWIMALFSVIFALVGPLRLFMKIDGWAEMYGAASIVEMQGTIKLLLFDSTLHFAVVAAAIFSGIYHFYYLHSSAQMDFYYSFPVKKEQYFYGKVWISYVYFVIPYTIMYVLTGLVLAGKGMMTVDTLKCMALIFVVDQFSYLLCFLATGIAMMLTGRILVGVMGTGVLLCFGIFLADVVERMQSAFFVTYTLYQNSIGQMLRYLAPAYLGYGVRSNLIYSANYSIGLQWYMILLLIGTAVVVVGLFFLGRYLTLARETEAAGHSMAFEGAARVIHMVLTIFGSLWFGLMVKDMAYSKPRLWMVIGIVFGAIIVYALIQFIYTLDVRQTFCYKWQLPAATILGLLIGAVFGWDLLGYDTYLPKESDLKYVSIKDADMDSSSSYSYNVGGITVSGDDYYLDHFNVACDPDIYGFLQTLVQTQEKDKEQDQDQEVATSFYSVTVRYTLNSGRKIDRVYSVQAESIKAKYAKSLEDENFREAIFPILREPLDENTVTMINLIYGGEQTELYTGKDPKLFEFMEVYRQELKELPGSVIVGETPVAGISYMYGADRQESWGYLPIYSQCTNTLAYLQTNHIDIQPLYTAERISQITVTDYSDSAQISDDSDPNQGEREIIFTDEEDIARIAPYLVDYDQVNTWQATEPDVWAEVTYMGSKGYDITQGFGLRKGVVLDE